MLYVVTAVHNRCEITKKFIRQLKCQTYKDYQLVLVDDGCTDGTVEMVRTELPNTKILIGDGNLFWGGALHLAYKWLSANVDSTNFVMFSNDDTTFDPEYLEKAVKHLNKNSNALITGCGYSINSNKQIDGAVHWDYRKGGVIKGFAPNDVGNCASTRSLFFSVETMNKIGGFHPILLPHYSSDYEWTMRGAKKGIEILSFDDLMYYFDEKTTGDNDFDVLTKKKLFSKRSIRNPIYRMSFIILSTPKHLLPAHLFHQINRYFGRMAVLRKIIRR